MHGYTKNVHYAVEVTFPLEMATGTKYILSIQIPYKASTAGTRCCLETLITVSGLLLLLTQLIKCIHYVARVRAQMTCVPVPSRCALVEQEQFYCALWIGSDRFGQSMYTVLDYQ